MKKNKNELDRISLIMSLIVLSFSILYGIFYFNKDMFSVTTNDYSLSETDKKDKGISYLINSMDAPNNYELVDHRYISSLYNMGELSYYDLNLNKLYSTSSNDIEVGVNHKLYVLNNENNSIEVSYLDNNELKKIDKINNVGSYNKVYYVNSNNNYYLLGFVINSDKEYFYLLDDDKLSVIESNDFSFCGDLVDNNIIHTYDTNHIVITSDNNTNYGVYDLENKKINIGINYEYIKSVGKNSYIINNDNSYSVYDGNMKRLSITYDYIDKVFNYYITFRDKKVTILDKDLKAITSLDYKINDELKDENNNIRYSDIFSYYKYKNDLILVDSNNKVFLINKEGKVYSKDIDRFSITNCLYYIKDNSIYLLDEELNELYSIDLSYYYNMNSVVSLKVTLYGNTLVVDDYNTKNYFSYSDGNKLDDIEDYDINFTESIKIRLHKVRDNDNEYNEVVLTVGEEEVKGLILSDVDESKLFKKINNNYYLFTDNKIIEISKKG